MTERALDAWWDDGTVAGTFIEVASRQVEFRSSDANHDRLLSASLPPGGAPASPWAAFHFLDNLLPEHPAIRGRIARQHGLDPNDSFGLLGAIGRECAGALILLPAGESPADMGPGYRALSDADFERWLEFRDSQPLISEPHGRVRLSLAGAQPKAALYFDDSDCPFIPEDGAPSTDIIKPAVRRALPNTVHIEWYCMELARAVLGCDRVASVSPWRRCLRVRRFDRVRDGDLVRRLHQEDLCQALGLAPSSKYEGRTTSRPDQTLLARCTALIDRLGSEGRLVPALEKQALFSAVMLNGLLMNADAHLKNHALLHIEGTTRIAPLYGVFCTAGIRMREGGDAGWQREPVAEVELERELALIIGDAKRVDTVDDEHWLDCGQNQMGLSRRFTRRLLDDMRERVLGSLQPVADRLLQDEPAAEPAVNAVREKLERSV